MSPRLSPQAGGSGGELPFQTVGNHPEEGQGFADGVGDLVGGPANEAGVGLGVALGVQAAHPGGAIGTVAVARLIGAGRHGDAARRSVQGIWLAALIGIAAAALLALVGAPVLGAFGAEGDVARFAELEPAGFLTKPFRLDELREAVTGYGLTVD